METVAREPDTGFRYWSFISYSHRDEAWGRWLHRALETYRIPSRLVGMPIDAGVVPARLTPIFRDRDELPTAADLDLSIVQALQQSYCMIVICSPASAASRWVDEEVLAFQRMGRGHRIYCLIVEGRDDAARTPCFPAALQSGIGDAFAEPLAADARHGHDGRFHAKLKLIGGILGVGFDKLVQREQHRKHRRTFAVACAAGIAFAVLSIFSVVAYTSRREAEAQRGHAEKLVEFMLGDLRRKLEPEGRLSTLDAVGKEALAYYASQQPGTLDADALARRARSLHLIGEVKVERGQIDDALTVFRQAAASTDELLARQPNDTQRIFDHAQSVYWVGNIAWQHGDYGKAEEAFATYKRLADRLMAADATDPKWQAEGEYAASNLGIALLRRGHAEEAQIAFEQALQLELRLFAANRSDAARQLELAQSYAWLADSLLPQGNISSAIEQREAEIAIYEEMLSVISTSREARGSLALAERALSAMSLMCGRTSLAIVQARRAVAIADQLMAEDAENMSATSAAALVYADLSNALFVAGDMKTARAAVERSHELAARLIRTDPQVVEWQQHFERTLLLEARLNAARGDALQSLRAVQGVLHTIDGWASAAEPDTGAQILRAQALSMSANMNDELGNESAGATERGRIVDLMNQNPFLLTDPRVMPIQADALRKLGQADASDVILKKLRDIGWRMPEKIGMADETGAVITARQ